MKRYKIQVCIPVGCVPPAFCLIVSKCIQGGGTPTQREVSAQCGICPGGYLPGGVSPGGSAPLHAGIHKPQSTEWQTRVKALPWQTTMQEWWVDDLFQRLSGSSRFNTTGYSNSIPQLRAGLSMPYQWLYSSMMTSDQLETGAIA